MSFFSGLFGDDSPFGRNCQEVETDPNADPFEKEICTTMRHFEESFSRFPGFGPPVEFQDHESSSEKTTDTPQSRREAILSRPTPEIREKDSRRSDSQRRRDIWHPSVPRADQNLDAQIAEDPSALDEMLQNDHAPSFRERHSSDRRPHSHSHSSSVIISTIRKPDGTIEQRRTVRDSDGNEEVTVSHYRDGERDGGITSNRGPGRGMFGRLSDWLSGND